MNTAVSPTLSPLILLTGATGYIGGRLAPRLLQLNSSVRCLARDLGRLPGRTWRDQVEWAEGDVLKPESLASALSGVHIAYYLVHSLGSGSDFPERGALDRLLGGVGMRRGRTDPGHRPGGRSD